MKLSKLLQLYRSLLSYNISFSSSDINIVGVSWDQLPLRIPPDLRDHVEKHKLSMSKSEHVLQKRSTLLHERDIVSSRERNDVTVLER